MKTLSLKGLFWTVLAGFWAALGVTPAFALPSFARQTGMSCAACHTVYPELTTYGRTFKLNGYTTTNTDELKDGSDENGYRLQINNTPPLAVMMQISDTYVKKPLSPNGVDLGSDNNGYLEFPNQLSLFYAGKIAPKMGAFAQVTYEAATGAFSMDNTDIRMADRYQVFNTDLVLGLTANNNPTVQDVFNSTPAWSFPYAANNTGFGVPAMTQVEKLAGTVAGLGGYLFWNQLLYAEISAYRSAPQGFGAPLPPGSYGAIQGFTPYWRIALTKDFDKHSIEVGAYGLDEHSDPNGAILPEWPQDHFTDVAVDGQYQYVDKTNCFTLKGSCIWENQVLDYSYVNAVSANPKDTLQSLKVDATYYYDRKIGATVGYFSTTGSDDTDLYATNDAANSPGAQGMVYEINYVPWYNTKFGLQYIAFFRYNGSVTNYDGAGRNASDNNTLMANVWLMY